MSLLGSVAAASLAAPATAALAQLTATLDAGASSVEYDEFLRSTAFTLTPSLRIERRGGTLLARGAYSRFEGGSESVQGLVAASIVSPAIWRLRGELLGAVGGTRYNGARSSTNIIAAARAHLVGRSSGGWLGGGAGAVTTGIFYDRRDILQLDAGAWVRTGRVVLSAAVTPTRIGNERLGWREFTDAVATAHWTLRRGEVTASAGHRIGDTGAGVRDWGEVNGIGWLTRRLALVAGLGAYPTDVTQGLPGGRYAAVAIRIVSRASSVFEPIRRGDLRLPYEVGRRGDSGARPFSIVDDGAGMRTIRIVITNAHRVELMGDFTDWEPIDLALDENGAWTATLRIAPGAHRLNVRVDGGPWIAPPGLSAVRDDFGGEVGVFVVR